MTAKILILGKDGQVGRALVKLLREKSLAAGRGEADLLDRDFIRKLEAWVGDTPLSAVINAAAYTQVDKAEGEGRAAVFRINGAAVGELAAWCRKRDLPLVHYSTDYVFDGSGSAPRCETDAAAPVNAYGASKLMGEQAIQAQGGRYVIFRTSWVYDAWGKNFFTTILRLLHEKESLNVVADQIGAPTYAPHLAKAALQALHANIFPQGIYHLCNSGETSWHGFAEQIFALARKHESGQGSAIVCQQVNPIPSSAYPLPAPRPLNSRLDCTKARERLGIALPHWQEGLRECIEERYAGTGMRTGGS